MEPANNGSRSLVTPSYNLINRELDDEGFGLFSSPIRVGAFEFLCRSIVSAPTLAAAIERSIRYLRLLLPDLVVRLDVHADQALLCISEARILSIGRVFAFEWLLRLLHGLFSWLVGRRVVGAINLGVRRIAGFESQFLVLGGLAPDGTVHLLAPDADVPLGAPVA